MNANTNGLNVSAFHLKFNDIGFVHVPEDLSRLSHKRDLYSIDPYFREGWEDVQAHAGVMRRRSPEPPPRFSRGRSEPFGVI